MENGRGDHDSLILGHLSLGASQHRDRAPGYDNSHLKGFTAYRGLADSTFDGMQCIGSNAEFGMCCLPSFSSSAIFGLPNRSNGSSSFLWIGGVPLVLLKRSVESAMAMQLAIHGANDSSSRAQLPNPGYKSFRYRITGGHQITAHFRGKRKHARPHLEPKPAGC